ncbi:MAG: ATP adenylyltransferase, partial [Cyanobium sp.]
MGRAERLWQAGLQRSEQARAKRALVPLATDLLSLPGSEPFEVRRLLGATPKHLRASGPRPNPFLPWDPRLEVSRLGDTHV